MTIYFALTINVIGASSGCAALRNKTTTGPGEIPRPRGARGPVIQPPLRASPQSPEEPSAPPHPPLSSYRKPGVYKTKDRGRSVSDNKIHYCQTATLPDCACQTAALPDCCVFGVICPQTAHFPVFLPDCRSLGDRAVWQLKTGCRARVVVYFDTMLNFSCSAAPGLLQYDIHQNKHRTD